MLIEDFRLFLIALLHQGLRLLHVADHFLLGEVIEQRDVQRGVAPRHAAVPEEEAQEEEV